MGAPEQVEQSNQALQLNKLDREVLKRLSKDKAGEIFGDAIKQAERKEKSLETLNKLKEGQSKETTTVLDRIYKITDKQKSSHSGDISLFDIMMQNWESDIDKIKELNLIAHITEYHHAASDEKILIIPELNKDGDGILISRISDTTIWNTNGLRKDNKLKDGKLPDELKFKIDASSYILHTAPDEGEDKITRDGIEGEDDIGRDKNIQEMIKEGDYQGAIGKLASTLYKAFIGKGYEKDKALDEYYNLGPLLVEIKAISNSKKLTDEQKKEEFQNRINNLSKKIENSPNRESKIRLTRCIGIIKDHLHYENTTPIDRLQQEADIGDSILINKSNNRVSGIGGRLGEALLESYEPGYAFTHIAIITSKDPLEITHSTSGPKDSKGGPQTVNLEEYAKKTPFEGMILKPNCDDSRKQKIGNYAKNLVGKGLTYDNKSAAMDTIGQMGINKMLDGGKALNCGEFVAKVMVESGPQMAAGLAGEPIPNDFIDKVDGLYTPTYSGSIGA